MWAVLPAKDLVDAKQRLAGALSPAERRLLFRTMYEDVLTAASQATALDGILVVTRDPEAAAVARAYGARLIEEAENQGQTAAIERAAAALKASGARGMVTVPGDTPLITAAEIDAVLAAHDAAPAMTIVPAHDRRGSNCIAVSPPGLIPFSFGNDSFQPHLAAARERGIEPRIIDLPGIALDIDMPDDLRMLIERGGATRTHAYLESNGIAARLCDEPRRAGGAGS
jgi:2-phospho-L-lactate/phosphoenolpyruvate guanylyltransferase